MRSSDLPEFLVEAAPFSENDDSIRSQEQDSTNIDDDDGTIGNDSEENLIEEDDESDSNEITETELNPDFWDMLNKTGTKPNGEIENDDEKMFTCVDCDSRIDHNHCFHIRNVEYFGMCHSKIGQCYTALLDGEVVRGCVGDEVFPTFESTGLQNAAIELCNNDRLCNQRRIEDTCIICNGNECEKSNVEKEKACSFGKPSGCYLKKSDKIERGCLRMLNERDQLECHKRGSSVCQSCNSQNCNRKVDFEQKCYYCNGTVQSDADCHIGNANHIDITCIGYASTCIVGIDADGFTHRQCSLNENEDTARFPKGYELCYGNLCNSNSYPKERKKCFKCSGTASCNNPSADLLSEDCRRFPDECFIYRNKEGTSRVNNF